MLTSGRNGAAAEKLYDCTGAETGLGNLKGCGSSSLACHGSAATANIAVLLELDSAGVATTHYTGGMTYTVKITGTNNGTTTQPAFGFQVSCILDSTAVTTPTNAGTFATTGLPTNVRYTATNPTDYVCNVIEHSNPITPTTGSGGNASTYVESFQWTAPVSGTGTISFWGVLNAVNGNGSADAGDLWNTTQITIDEWPVNTGIASVTNHMSVTAFPNPMVNNLNVKMDNALAGTYSVQVLDINGKTLTTENITINSASHTSNINTSNWLPGTYKLVVEKDGNRQVIPVVKL